MADLERQFREAMQPEASVADQPAMMGEGDEGDMRCPMCGASAKKIEEAAGGGAGGGMGMGGGGMKMGGGM